MRHVKFTVQTDDDFGDGVVPNIFKNWASYRPTQDFGLAHDLLEHTAHETGEVWQEFQALGGLCYVRHFGSYQTIYDKKHYATRTGEAFCYELENIYRDATEFETGEDIPEIALRKFRGKIEGNFKMLFHALRLKAKEAWDMEHNEDYEEGEEFYTPCPYLDKLELIEAHVREGYYKARRRYKGEDVYHVREAIMREFNKKWSSLQQYSETGEEFTLSYDLDGHCEITGRALWF